MPGGNYRNVGIITDGLTIDNNSIAFRNSVNNLMESLTPSTIGDVLGYAPASGSNPAKIEYKRIDNWIGYGLSQGAFWAGTGSNSAAAVAIPSAFTGTGPAYILRADTNSSTKMVWGSLRDALQTAFTTKGELLVGSSTGGEFLPAPKTDEVLVGDTGTATGWRLKNISDIVPTSTANSATSSAAALIFANSNLG